MKIFLCWSGERSQGVAKELGEWMPKVIQAIEPWFSEKNINKGALWPQQLFKNLEECNFGIVCLTPENLDAPWLLFESGALSKAVKESHVCTLTFKFDQLLVKGPLSHFQTTKLEKDDMLKLMTTINENLDEKDNSLSEKFLEEIFSKWWPELEEKLNVIPQASEPTTDERLEIDILKETLEIVRRLDRQSRTVSMSILADPPKPGDLIKLLSMTSKYERAIMASKRLGGSPDAKWVDFEDPETK